MESNMKESIIKNEESERPRVNFANISETTKKNKSPKKEKKYPELYQKEDTRTETLDLSSWVIQKEFTFDYEINNIKLDNGEDQKKEKKENTLNTKMLFYDKNCQADRIINYNYYKDNKRKPPEDPKDKKKKKSLEDPKEEKSKSPKKKEVKYTANLFKRLVSKKKRRLQTKDFDLDMSYITDRVIAMGYPSIGCEKFYRNDVADVIAFFQKYHKGNVKIYNLCLEKNRIYEKSLFNREKVALFPSNDHNPCPIKLILEFCVDICLFLVTNLDSVAAVHCKAGKGRTGVMICCYLIFSGLCKDVKDALEYYAKMRTTNGRGVTIPSQVRYIKYYETFLKANFYPPYIYLIPKIIREHIFVDGKKPTIKNLLINLEEDERYYKSPNSFRVNEIIIGPLPKESFLKITIETSTKGKFKFKINETFTHDDKGHYYHYTVDNDNGKEYPIHSDIKINVSGPLNFYMCLNLWYTSLDVIDRFLHNEDDTFKLSNKKSLQFKDDDKKSNKQKSSKKNIFRSSSSDKKSKKKKPVDDDDDFGVDDSDDQNDEDNINNNTNNCMTNMITTNTKMTHKRSSLGAKFRRNNPDNTNNQCSTKNQIKELENEKEKAECRHDKEEVKKNGFLIFNEDKIEYTNKKSKDINDMLENKVSMKNIQHGSDLDTIITKLNISRKEKNQPIFNKDNITIKLQPDELDKFKEKKKVKDLVVTINYAIK